ncbi:MAG TPA: GHMP kinase [bacterium]|mgnify:FL=1|nr:GHMP kinase [bacterium]HQO33748.1 GHMP kinase [bacterium]HQQ00172.1 GHMP kinase [bacterium]
MVKDQPTGVRKEFEQFQKNAPKLFGDLLQPGRKVFVARAPGRLDVMGGIADYCGSLVQEMPLKEAVFAGIQKRKDSRIVIRSVEAGKEGFYPDVEYSLEDFYSARGLKSYSEISSELKTDPRKTWASYVAGIFFVLEKERLAPPFQTGATVCLTSSVPFGSGIASSAALEVAVLYGVLAAYGLQMEGLKAARAAQIAENRVAGAPCGIMDQVTAVLGEDRALLALRCQPHTVEGTVSIPEGFRLVGIHSNVKHSVGGARYTDTRIGAFMGHKIILTELGAKEDPFDGYLARIPPDEYRTRYRRFLPSRIEGAEFLRRYGGTVDPVTRVDPGKTYAVRSRTEHPIYENNRAGQFREILQSLPQCENVDRAMVRLGRLMYASHWSYGRRCGMGCAETDLLVNLVRKAGSGKGLYGAKITGGGCGGTVAVLASEGTEALLRQILTRYAEQTGLEPRFFAESSPGAQSAGIHTFIP